MGDTQLVLWMQVAATSQVLQKLPYRHLPQFREGGMHNGRGIVAPPSVDRQHSSGFAKTTLPAPNRPSFELEERKMGDTLMLLRVQTATTARVLQKLPYRHPSHFVERKIRVADHNGSCGRRLLALSPSV